MRGTRNPARNNRNNARESTLRRYDEATQTPRACFAQAESMGFDGIHGAFWIGDSTGIDSPLGGGRCRRPILLIFEVG